MCSSHSGYELQVSAHWGRLTHGVQRMSGADSTGYFDICVAGGNLSSDGVLSACANFGANY